MAFAVLCIIGFIAYWVPTLAANSNRHRNRTAIAMLNLFLGWTVIGWVIALAWADTDNCELEKAVAEPSIPGLTGRADCPALPCPRGDVEADKLLGARRRMILADVELYRVAPGVNSPMINQAVEKLFPAEKAFEQVVLTKALQEGIHTLPSEQRVR